MDAGAHLKYVHLVQVHFAHFTLHKKYYIHFFNLEHRYLVGNNKFNLCISFTVFSNVSPPAIKSMNHHGLVTI